MEYYKLKTYTIVKTEEGIYWKVEAKYKKNNKRWYLNYWYVNNEETLKLFYKHRIYEEKYDKLVLEYLNNTNENIEKILKNKIDLCYNNKSNLEKEIDKINIADMFNYHVWYGRKITEEDKKEYRKEQIKKLFSYL